MIVCAQGIFDYLDGRTSVEGRHFGDKVQVSNGTFAVVWERQRNGPPRLRRIICSPTYKIEEILRAIRAQRSYQAQHRQVA
jgi:hypothetical protein